MDTVDHRATDEWLANLTEALDGRKPEYLIVSHMEPDHACQHRKAGGPLPGDERGGQRQDLCHVWISSSARRRLPKTAV